MKTAQTNTPDPLDEKIQENFLKLVLDFKDYAIIMLNSSGQIMSWSVGAEYIFGYNADEIINKHFSVFYSEEEIKKHEPENDLNLTKKNGSYERERRELKKDGTAFFANVVLTPVLNDDKSLQGFTKITRDITLQKNLAEENKILHDNLEEKVKQRTEELGVVNKELEAFSYSVSHDLRTPLRAISGYSMMLKEDYEHALDDEGKRLLNVIVDNTKLMGNLIDDLLSFSRMSRLEVIYEAINMEKIARSCIDDLLNIFSTKEYDITIQSLPTCKGDPSMLKQVWYNLIGNAIKYSSKQTNPKIEVGSINNEKMNIYYVKDNGVGFDMKYYNKLFGVFQRLHRQDEFEGTGLGLALSKRIVSKHLGDVWGESSLSNGAIFYFSIPKNYNNE